MLETNHNPHSLRIITADDDDLNLYILMKSLTDAGHTSTGFPDGDAIWEFLYAHPDEVDVVVLDKMMARMSGLEVIRRMKDHPTLKNIPTILQTGDADPARIKEGIDTGADRYITKPFRPNQLIDIIAEIAKDYGLDKNKHH